MTSIPDSVRFLPPTPYAVPMFVVLLLLLPMAGMALEPGEVLVVVNERSPKGIGIAEYYMTKRAIPHTNLLMVATDTEETCSRAEYERRIHAPVRKALSRSEAHHRIRCILLIYGLPLKIAPKEKGAHDRWASVDSEIALVLVDEYPLDQWVRNPYYVEFSQKVLPIEKKHVLMVSRLDGPSEKSVKRLIDDSIWAEEHGLSGSAHLDARWPLPTKTSISTYQVYDRSIHRAAEIVKGSNRMPVVLDEEEELFGAGKGLDTGLYCGWYSLASYVDAFRWRRGSVGYHIASSECATLKQRGSKVWCKMMLEKGVAATVGPVNEPYVGAFPPPEIFFQYLVEGYLTLAECYIVSVPFLSWKMVLIGDPLYRPFQIRR